MHIVEVVEAVVDELRDVVVDAGLGSLERGAAVDLMHAAIGLAAYLLDHDDAQECHHGADEHDEDHPDSLLLLDQSTLHHDSPLTVTLVL